MNTFYKLTDKIKAELEGNALINEVTYGDITEVDLDKQSLFPLAHVNFTDSIIKSSSVDINVNILFMDLVDVTKKDLGEFYKDNEHDVLNSMLSAATKTVQELKRGLSYSEGFHIEGDAEAEFFTDRFENKLAGVSVNFTVTLKNSADLC